MLMKPFLFGLTAIFFVACSGETAKGKKPATAAAPSPCSVDPKGEACVKACLEDPKIKGCPLPEAGTILAYPTARATWAMGEAIASFKPSLQQDAKAISDYAKHTFSVTPSLPQGISLDASSGEISGTPSEAVDGKQYVISIKGEKYNADFSLTITVSDGSTCLTDSNSGPPNPPVIPAATMQYTTPIAIGINAAMTPALPTITGATGSSFTIAPALPAGLTLNATTGEISGTPTTVSPLTTYLVTASIGETLTGTVTTTNTGTCRAALPDDAPLMLAGSASATDTNTTSAIDTSTLTAATSPTINPTTVTASIQIEVTAGACVAPTIDLAKKYVVLHPNTAITTELTPTVSGTAPTYTIAPTALIPGLTFNAANGAITGTPTELSLPKSYTIKSTNTCGNASMVIVIRSDFSAISAPTAVSGITAEGRVLAVGKINQSVLVLRRFDETLDTNGKAIGGKINLYKVGADLKYVKVKTVFDGTINWNSDNMLMTRCDLNACLSTAFSKIVAGKVIFGVYDGHKQGLRYWTTDGSEANTKPLTVANDGGKFAYIPVRAAFDYDWFERTYEIDGSSSWMVTRLATMATPTDNNSNLKDSLGYFDGTNIKSFDSFGLSGRSDFIDIKRGVNGAFTSWMFLAKETPTASGYVLYGSTNISAETPVFTAITATNSVFPNARMIGVHQVDDDADYSGKLLSALIASTTTTMTTTTTGTSTTTSEIPLKSSINAIRVYSSNGTPKAAGAKTTREALGPIFSYTNYSQTPLVMACTFDCHDSPAQERIYVNDKNAYFPWSPSVDARKSYVATGDLETFAAFDTGTAQPYDATFFTAAGGKLYFVARPDSTGNSKYTQFYQFSDVDTAGVKVDNINTIINPTGATSEPVRSVRWMASLNDRAVMITSVPTDGSSQVLLRFDGTNLTRLLTKLWPGAGNETANIPFMHARQLPLIRDFNNALVYVTRIEASGANPAREQLQIVTP